MVSDGWDRQKLIETAVPIMENNPGQTMRGLHYQLVSRGMPNTINCYKRLIAAMTDARWDGLLPFDIFSDHERDILGEPAYDLADVDGTVETAMYLIRDKLSPRYLTHDRWANQPEYVEVWIEKKALQGAFEAVCNRLRVVLFPCKGYPSLTWLDKAMERFSDAADEGKKCTIIYFGDYDPSGEDIPRSLQVNLERMGVEIEVDRKCLLEEQVVSWKLPVAPTKAGDTRSTYWDGQGQVELDAVLAFYPERLAGMCEDAISEHFDWDIHKELKEQEKEDRKKYLNKIKPELKKFLEETDLESDDEDEDDSEDEPEDEDE